MPRYRFRTKGLLGAWHDERSEAEQDAVRAGQAYRCGEAGKGLVWRVPGEIEEAEEPLGEQARGAA